MLWPSGPTSHRMPTIFFAVQQKVVRPLDLAIDAVALAQGVADGQTGKQRQRGGLDQIGPDNSSVVQALVGRIKPAAAKAAPPGGLVGGVDRADGTELVQIMLGPKVGAVYLGQVNNALVQNSGTLFQVKLHLPFSIVMTP